MNPFLNYSLLCIVVIMLCVTQGFLIIFLRHLTRSVYTTTTTRQGSAVREYIDDVTEKIIRIALETNNNDKELIEEPAQLTKLESMLSDVLRESGIDPLLYDVRSLLLATINKLRHMKLI